jgi:Tfp pilus assembly protein PilF
MNLLKTNLGKRRKTAMDDPVVLLARAKAALERGDKESARILLDDIVFRQPDNQQAWLLLAEVVENANEREDCLRQAQAIKPDNLILDTDVKVVEHVIHPSPYADEATLKFDESRIEWKRSAAGQALYSQALSAAGGGDRLKAEALLDEQVAQQPQDVQAWWVLAQVAIDEKKAAKCLQQVLAVVPDHAGANRRLEEIKAKRVKENEG